MRLTELDPRWVGSGGEGIYQETGRPCPVCPPGAPREDCRQCLGRGKEYESAPERHGVGISFLCPCQTCAAKRTGDADTDFYLRHFIPFTNPLDGGPPPDPRVTWQRTGEDFESLTLTPSILSDTAKGGCGWHGFIRNGNVTGA